MYIALRKGDFNAEFDRDEIARMMSAEDVAQAEKLAEAWLAEFEAAKAE